MSINGVPRSDFRSASGLTRWPAVLANLGQDGSPDPQPCPDLARAARASGEAVITSTRRLADPGRALVTAAAVMLGLLAAGLFVVTLNAQYKYVFAAKGQAIPSMIEAASLDLGMVIFTLLALGLAMAGQSDRIGRALIVACALGSAGQNYAAADVASYRSVTAYVVPSMFLALVVDRVVAVVRRHVLGDAERSAWADACRGAGSAGRVLGLVLLYLLRLFLAPRSTFFGLRRWILAATPVPAAHARQVDPAAETPAIGSPAAGKSGPGGASGEASPPLVPDPAAGTRNGQTTRQEAEPARRPPDKSRATDRRAAPAYEAVAAHYAAQLAAGRVPSGKDIRAQFRVGSRRAAEFHARLAAAAAARAGG